MAAIDGLHQEGAIARQLYLNRDFASERELTNFVLANITQLIPEAECVERELTLPKGWPRRFAAFRLDAVVHSPEGVCVIEFKCPKATGVVELVNGVAQLQLYGLVYEDNYGIKPRLLLITNKINRFVTDYLKKFAPDVELIVVQRERHYIMEVQDGNAEAA